MRRLLLLSVALAALLLIILNVQRAVYESLTNRPFLGTWTPGPGSFRGGAQTYLEFARGGNLWITTFGQNGWSGHWEEGRWQELIISGLDPTRPKAKEAFHWSVSREGLSVFPMWRPGLLRPFSHPSSGYNLDFRYSHVGEKTWPTSEQFVGRWVTRIEPDMYRTRDGQVRRVPGARMLLDVRPGGKLWVYRDGQARHHGRWTGNSDGRSARSTFTCVEEDASHPADSQIWTGGIFAVPRRQPYLTLNLWGRQQDCGVSPRPRKPEDYLGSLSRVPEGPADRKPFIGVWRTRALTSGRHLQLELLPGGVFWITDRGRPRRRGTWKEEGPWPRLILVGFDPKEPDGETKWYWKQHAAFSARVRHADGEFQQVQVPERLNFVAATSPVAQPEDGMFVELVRVPTASKPTRK